MYVQNGLLVGFCTTQLIDVRYSGETCCHHLLGDGLLLT
jgi:hypothetical protein